MQASYRILKDLWFWGALALIAYLPLPSYMPEVEGAFYPVTSKIQIIDVIPSEDGGSMIHVSFSKKRNCDFVSVVWSRVNPNGDMEAAFVDFSKTNRVPVGGTVSTTWRVDLDPETIRNFSVSKVTHSCHFGWNTITQLWP